MAVPPIELIRIEAELASIRSMLETLAETKQEEEQRRFGVVPVRDLSNIFAPCGTTIRAARGNKVLKFRAGDDEKWSVDKDWYPEDDKGDCVVIGVERKRDEGA